MGVVIQDDDTFEWRFPRPAIYLERLELMLTQDGPHYPNWDQDATAIEQRYDQASADVVAGELCRAAGKLADRFDSVGPQDWSRTGYGSDGAAFTVDTFARYFVHDPIHHLWDVQRPA